MGEAAMLGWSATEAHKLISLCNEFRKAYSNGGQGASRHLSDLCAKIENFETVLGELKNQVKSHHSKLYINYTSIENTLKDCKTFFDKHPIYLKAPEQRSNREQYLYTVDYVLSAKKEVERLCTMVESHYSSIHMYLGLLNTKYNTQHLKQNDDLSQKVDRIDNKLTLILRQQRHYSVAGIPTLNSISPSASLSAERSASQQLVDLEIDYAILTDLRKKSTNEGESQVLDIMISDLSSLKDRVKNLAERAGNMGAQKQRRKLAVNRMDSGFISDVGDSSDEDEEEGEQSMTKVIESGDSAVSFRSSNFLGAAEVTATAATSTEPLSPGEKPKELTQEEEKLIEEIKDVEIEMSVGQSRETFSCTLQARFCNNHLTEISANPLTATDVQLPVITFGNNRPRPTPNIEWRGPKAPKRYCVMLKGNTTAISPACQPVYKFSFEHESNKFQELVHGKKLLFDYSRNVKNIQSKAGYESDTSVLRIWRDSLDKNDVSLSSHSLMYYHNTAKNLALQQPIEIFLTDFEWPPPKGQKPLKLKFKEGIRTKQKYLEITFREDAKELCSYLQKLKG